MPIKRCLSTYFVLVAVVMLVVNGLGYAVQDVVGLDDILRDGARPYDEAEEEASEMCYICSACPLVEGRYHTNSRTYLHIQQKRDDTYEELRPKHITDNRSNLTPNFTTIQTNQLQRYPCTNQLTPPKMCFGRRPRRVQGPVIIEKPRYSSSSSRFGGGYGRPGYCAPAPRAAYGRGMMGRPGGGFGGRRRGYC